MSNLLKALEASVAECKRLQQMVNDLEYILEGYRKEEEEEDDLKPKRRNNRPKRSNRTYRPWQKEDELPMPQIEVSHRRNINDIYKEQKQKHEAEVEKQRNKEQTEEKETGVVLSQAKKNLLIEKSKAVMNKTGN